MFLSDTISRLPDPKDEESIPHDERVDGVEWTLEVIDFDDIDLMNFTRNKQEELHEETGRDHSLLPVEGCHHPRLARNNQGSTDINKVLLVFQRRTVSEK